MLLMSEVSNVVFSAVYRLTLLMLEMSKVNSFIYYVHHSMNKRSKIMLKVSKETQNILYRLMTFLLITFLTFN